jgi:hypothetical protein
MYWDSCEKLVLLLSRDLLCVVWAEHDGLRATPRERAHAARHDDMTTGITEDIPSLWTGATNWYSKRRNTLSKGQKALYSGSGTFAVMDDDLNNVFPHTSVLQEVHFCFDEALSHFFGS